jgi:serine/threonine-protein kinase
MGEVVSARDEQIGRPVAIKRIRRRDAGSEAVARFLREARIQGRLDHPAIVPVHQLIETGDESFFVMKQLAGTTLQTRLADGRTARHQLLRAFVDVCLAIEFAHTRGIIHRDLKPANVMLGDFGEVYVLDWGIARVLGDDEPRTSFADIESIDGGATTAGALLGTPGYMSPEQIRGEADLDGRSDVYALGCVLFEILAGKPLHPHGQAGLASALAGNDARASRHADVPPELDAACVMATAVERDARFASARALADAVQRYLDGDRDLTLRRELSHNELATARAAVDRDDRIDALRAAARALALDPRAGEPAELVGRLMLEPPTAAPPEVELELAELTRRDLVGRVLRDRLLIPGLLLFLPVLYCLGVHDAWFFATVGVSGTGLFVANFVIVPRHNGAYVIATIVVDAVVLVAVGYVTTPILVAPGLAAVLGGLLAANQSRKLVWAIGSVFVAAVAVPWALQLAHVLPRTVEVVGNAMVLHLSAAALAPTITIVGSMIWCAALSVVSVSLVWASSVERSRMQRALQTQAWQLRQLIPRA